MTLIWVWVRSLKRVAGKKHTVIFLATNTLAHVRTLSNYNKILLWENLNKLTKCYTNHHNYSIFTVPIHHPDYLTIQLLNKIWSVLNEERKTSEYQLKTEVSI